MRLNGAAARRVPAGDLAIIADFVGPDVSEARRRKPSAVHVDQHHRILG